MVYSVYDESTGEIQYIRTTQMPAPDFSPLAFIEGEYPGHMYYVVDGAPSLLKEMPCSLDTTTVTANGVDMATISGAPSGADILIDGVSQGQSDGTDIELTFDLSGQYVVTLSLFPYLDWQETIDAN